MGFPCKSGVGGALMIVIPNVMGICTFSPRLDPIGNSARGVSFCRRLVTMYSFHNYDSLKGLDSASNAGSGNDEPPTGDHMVISGKKDPRRNDHDANEGGDTPLIWAAAENNLSRARHLIAQGFDVSAGDYDERTPLHLAADDNHVDMVRFLLQMGADACRRDRFGHNPRESARRMGHEPGSTVVAILEVAESEQSLEAAALSCRRHMETRMSRLERGPASGPGRGGEVKRASPASFVPPGSGDFHASSNGDGSGSGSGNVGGDGDSGGGGGNPMTPGAKERLARVAAAGVSAHAIDVHRSLQDVGDPTVRMEHVIAALHVVGLREDDVRLTRGLDVLRDEAEGGAAGGQSDGQFDSLGKATAKRLASVWRDHAAVGGSGVGGKDGGHRASAPPRVTSIMGTPTAPRTEEVGEVEEKGGRGGVLSPGALEDAMAESEVLKRAFEGSLVVQDWPVHCTNVDRIYDKTIGDTTGDSAQYIPQVRSGASKREGVGKLIHLVSIVRCELTDSVLHRQSHILILEFCRTCRSTPSPHRSSPPWTPISTALPCARSMGSGTVGGTRRRSSACSRVASLSLTASPWRRTASTRCTST
jgi:hypothetical protein